MGRVNTCRPWADYDESKLVSLYMKPTLLPTEPPRPEPESDGQTWAKPGNKRLGGDAGGLQPVKEFVESLSSSPRA